MKSQEACDHRIWVYPLQYEHFITGEFVDAEPYQVFTYKDVSLDKFRCTQCGYIGYYTGLWRNFYENGISCPGSDAIDR